MTAAWEQIRAWEQVTLSIDCFHFGIVFFDPAVREKQHLKVLRAAWKPWPFGTRMLSGTSWSTARMPAGWLRLN